MSKTERPVGEDDLTAYVDGELDAARRAHVEAWLKDHPQAAARVEADLAVNARLKAALAPLGETSLPARFRVENAAHAMRARRLAMFSRMAAVIALLFIGGAGGWFLNDWRSAESGDSHTVAEAVAAHRLFVADKRHPVEVGADAKDHLGAWLGNRIGEPISIPDLSDQGLTLVGGRLLSGDDGPYGQIMYEAKSGKRITLFVKAGSGRESAFAFAGSGDARTLAWRSPELSFVLTGPFDRARLVTIAHDIYHGGSN